MYLLEESEELSIGEAVRALGLGVGAGLLAVVEANDRARMQSSIGLAIALVIERVPLLQGRDTGWRKSILRTAG